MKIVLMTDRVAAGFPSPANDYIENALDLNEHLVKHPAATFFVQADGDSMRGAGIFSGDLLIVDRSLEAMNGDVVVAVIDGEFTVKTLHRSADGVFLNPANRGYNPIRVDSCQDFRIWGVVTATIHQFTGKGRGACSR